MPFVKLKTSVVTATIIIPVVTLVTSCVLRALFKFRFSKERNAKCDDSEVIAVTDDAIKRFSEAIKFRTISWKQGEFETDQLLAFARFIETSFPAIHSTPFIIRETIQKYSILFTINGSDPTLKPYLLIAHIDVVPAEEDKWSVSPFDGTVKDGYVYGRGTIDMKHIVMGILEATEYLLKNGFRPKRSFFIAFGHDEEVSGHHGAKFIAEHLKTKGVNDIEFLLDEGTMILPDMFPGVPVPVAAVSVAEKGIATIRITAKGEAGHSSMPPENSAIVKLCSAVSKFTPNLHRNVFGTGIEKEMIEAIAPYATFGYKLMYANLWLFKSLLASRFSSNASTNSMIRTSTAMTMLRSGVKDNVLPSEAEAVVNHRVHPVQSIEEVLKHDRAKISDENISVELIGTSVEPSPISPTNENSNFSIIKNSIRDIFGNIPVVPSILVAGTDSKWYMDLTDSVYRFNPIILRLEDIKMLHGHNERLAIADYGRVINFYRRIIINANESVR